MRGQKEGRRPKVSPEFREETSKKGKQPGITVLLQDES